MLNAITVDVEEYFHATNLEPYFGPAKWHSLPSRVDESTRRLLDLFARNGVKGTFFILGYVARRHPKLVQDIAREGHEIASHGYGHRLVYNQTPRAFFRDVRKTKYLLEDLTGAAVLGYRAPNFSIRDKNLWAYDELIRAGYRYDSSLYPVRHERYGNLNRSYLPERLQRHSGELAEFPLAVSPLRLLGKEYRLPVAGGAWWRLFPSLYILWALRRMRHPRNCYLHPWEIDAGQPRVALPFLTRIRHYTGVGTFENKIERFLRAFEFTTVSTVAQEHYPEILPE